MFRLLKDLASFIVGLIEILLVFRFLLKFLGASSASPIVAWIYSTTAPLLQPFLFAFPTPSVQGGFTLEFTTLFAMFAFAFVGYLIQEVLEIIDSRGSHSHRK